MHPAQSVKNGNDTSIKNSNLEELVVRRTLDADGLVRLVYNSAVLFKTHYGRNRNDSSTSVAFG